MATIRVIASLESDTGLPEDRAVNVWHFLGSASVGNLEQLVADLLGDWYGALDGYLSSTLSGAINFRCYDLADPEPRVPIYEDDATITPGTDTYPREVAVVVSFKAAGGSGANMARRRGRTYLGPLSTGPGGTYVVSNGDLRPSGTIAQAFADQLAILQATLFTDGYQLAVYSRADNVARAAVEAWVDNAFDTQRRRGGAPTTRYTADLS